MLYSPPLIEPPNAPVPIPILYVSASKPSPACSPIIILCDPVVINKLASLPIATLLPPVVIADKA